MVHGANNSEPCSLQRGSAMHVLGKKPFRLKTLIRVPTAMGLCPGMGTKLCFCKENHSKGVSVQHILCFSEAQSETQQTFVLEDHHLPPACRSERIAMHCQGQKKEMEFHWAVKRHGQSTGREPVLLHSLCDFTTSQFPGGTFVYLNTAWCLHDTSFGCTVKPWHKTMFQYPCTSCGAAG